jgi:ADP-ribosylglycohydrolase
VNFAHRVAGCLLGGALGDAIGYPIEFINAKTIAARFGREAPPRLAFAGPPPAHVSDDTQMTLFSIEGILRAVSAAVTREDPRWPMFLLGAYQRWHGTQAMAAGQPMRLAGQAAADSALELRSDRGPLWAEPRLHARRAPGNTCLSAIARSFVEPRAAAPDAPANGSKGCGAVMRSAPFGVVGPTRADAFAAARDAGALTHGHPTGFLSGAYLAAVVFGLVRGEGLGESLAHADALLDAEAESDEVAAAVAQARRTAAAGVPSVERIEALGGGWTGEEALAIGLCCALTHDAGGGPQATASTLWRAAAHGGDSDSTASIAGNLVGALVGCDALPASWLEQLELRDLIARLAGELAAAASGGPVDRTRYPAEAEALVGITAHY